MLAQAQLCVEHRIARREVGQRTEQHDGNDDGQRRKDDRQIQSALAVARVESGRTA